MTSQAQSTAVNSIPMIHDLLRRVIQHLTPAGPQLAMLDDSVLLTAELDGVRVVMTRAPGDADATSLSTREQQIAGMIARGLSDKKIAAALQISRHTVATYLRRMYAKLGVSSRAALIARIMGSGALKD